MFESTDTTGQPSRWDDRRRPREEVGPLVRGGNAVPPVTLRPACVTRAAEVLG